MKTIIYARVSTFRQDTDRQVEELQAYAGLLGLEVTDVYEEKESGLKDDRPMFRKLCSLDRSEVDCVLVWSLDRLGRKTSTILKTIEDFTDRGICVVTKKENIRTLDASGKTDANAQLFISVLGSIAQMEAATIKERMTSGKLHKLRARETPHADKVPYGYRKVDGRLVVEESEAETVRTMYRMVAEGYSRKVVCLSVGKPQSTVEYILHNEVYRGVGRNVLTPDETYETPRIVDDDTWEKCQVRKPCTFKKDREAAPFPLRLKVVCPVCGRHYAYTGPRPGRPGRLTCTKSPGALGGVPHPTGTASLNAEDLEAAVRKAVETWKSGVSELRGAPESPESIKRYLEVLEDDRERKKRVLELAEKKYSAVAAYLTDSERKAELRALAALADSVENSEVELFAARRRYDNAVAVSAAPFMLPEPGDWSALVREVRMTGWSRTERTFGVDLVSGETLDVTVPIRHPLSDRKKRGKK